MDFWEKLMPYREQFLRACFPEEEIQTCKHCGILFVPSEPSDYCGQCQRTVQGSTAESE